MLIFPIFVIFLFFTILMFIKNYTDLVKEQEKWEREQPKCKFTVKFIDNTQVSIEIEAKVINKGSREYSKPMTAKKMALELIKKFYEDGFVEVGKYVYTIDKVANFEIEEV